MPIRRKRSRLAVVSTPQQASEGRRAAIAPAVSRMPVSRSVGEMTIRLAVAMLDREHARAVERDNPTAEHSHARRCADKRAREASYRLAQLTSRANANAIRDALLADGGALLRRASLAPPDTREHLLAAAASHAAVASEHDLTATASRIMLGRAAAWAGLADAMLAEAMRTRGDERAKAIAGAHRCDQASRLDLLGALELEKRARDEHATTQAQPVDVRAVVAEAERRAHQAEGDDHDDDSDHDSAAEGEGEGDDDDA